MNTEVNTSNLKVLSLNCWGLYLVSKKRRFRLESIANYLNEQDYDIIALQEVWMIADYEYIKEKLSEKLPFAKYFYSGSLGSGLVLISKFPVLSSTFLKFTLAGKPLKVFQGDFYVGKGLASVCIDHPQIGLMDIYTTHLQAGYGNHDDYEAQRVTECWQIANSVRASAAQGRHVILTGDFNSIPSSNCYQILKNHGFMADSWLEVHEPDMATTLGQFERNQLTASECIQLFGITCDSPLNTWTKHLLKQQPYAKDIGDRLDYIFYRKSPEIACQESKVVMDKYIQHTEYSFSDHFAVESVFKISVGANSALGNFAPLPKQLARPDFTQLLPETLHTVLYLIEQDLVIAKRSYVQLLFLSGLSVCTVVGLYLLQLILPLYNPQLNVLNALYGVLLVAFTFIAIISFLVGFIFGNTEQRSLRQYLAEIALCLNIVNENARRQSLQSAKTSTAIEQCLIDGSSLSSSISAQSTINGATASK